MAKPLAGRVALVTGGSRGIGAAIAKRLAADGADVAVSYVASADKAKAVVDALEGHGVRAAAPFMVEGGRIISIGSVAGSRAPWPGFADYSASKAAVAAYTRGWARDLGPKGVTVNVVQPGPIDTDMNPADGAFAEVGKAATALGRYGTPEEVAAAVAFLASPDAAFITGATLAWMAASTPDRTMNS